MDEYQYRVTVQDAVGPILSHYDADRWSQTVAVCEERGLYAKIERRLLTDAQFVKLIGNPPGYICLPNGRAVCPWIILAEADYR
jgi:hypothetical protein